MIIKHWVATAGLAAIIVVIAWLFLPRYQLALAGEGAVAYKLDTWTGDVWFCNGIRKECEELHASELPVIDPDEIDAAIKARQDQSQVKGH